MMRGILVVFWLLSQASFAQTISGLKLLNIKEIPNHFTFNNTTVGGLSGIDFDPTTNQYYLICDDRSALQSARFYTATITISEKGIDTVMITAVTTLRQPDGTAYPAAKQNPALTPDPESIRINPTTKLLTWSSEGERIVRNDKLVLTNPSLNTIDPQGKWISSFSLPAQLTMSQLEKGPRQNGTLEGITFADDYKTLYAALEEPLYEDGPRADLIDNNPWVRFYKFDVKSGKNTAQYAYRLEKVAYAPTPSTAFMVNGIPDILSINNHELLVIERSFSTGRLPCTVKLFITDISKGEDICTHASLTQQPPRKPLDKKLLLNMDDLGVYVDNVEGATLGPVLPNGHRTLLLVTDDNFQVFEKTQFFLFEIIP